MDKVEQRVVTRPKGSLQGFQSAEALAKATSPSAPDDVSTDSVSGVVEEASPDMEAAAAERESLAKMVKVRCHSFQQFRYGDKMYTIQPNKDTLVPQCVRLHMEEKGLI